MTWGKRGKEVEYYFNLIQEKSATPAHALEWLPRTKARQGQENKRILKGLQQIHFGQSKASQGLHLRWAAVTSFSDRNKCGPFTY